MKRNEALIKHRRADKREIADNHHKWLDSQRGTLLAVGASNPRIARKGGVWEHERIENPYRDR